MIGGKGLSGVVGRFWWIGEEGAPTPILGIFGNWGCYPLPNREKIFLGKAWYGRGRWGIYILYSLTDRAKFFYGNQGSGASGASRRLYIRRIYGMRYMPSGSYTASKTWQMGTKGRLGKMHKGRGAWFTKKVIQNYILTSDLGYVIMSAKRGVRSVESDAICLWDAECGFWARESAR